jgi:ferrochelatase
MHCCDEIRAENRQCYRAHCFASSRSIASRLGLDANDWSVSFQSRLGRTEWIRPYTDEVIPDLARRGVRHLAVLCPSFTADCLETIEEMGMRGRELFLQAGGEKFTLVPCLNSHSMWVDGVLAIASK